jgi:hypothetical protein
MPCSSGTRVPLDEAARRREAAGRIEFAPNDEIEALRPFVDEFWARILGTSYTTSFVSNESTLESWQHYVGGRSALIEQVRRVYGVDISSYYSEPIPTVLRRVREGAA